MGTVILLSAGTHAAWSEHLVIIVYAICADHEQLVEADTGWTHFTVASSHILSYQGSHHHLAHLLFVYTTLSVETQEFLYHLKHEFVMLPLLKITFARQCSIPQPTLLSH